MQITTVGAALEFAGELEEKAQTFYAQEVNSAYTGKMKEAFADLAEGNGRRQNTLRRLYDDNVYSDMDTGVLAPITSMDRENYTLTEPEQEMETEIEILERALGYEITLQNFYGDLTVRLQSGPRTITRRIDTLAKDVGDRLGVLETLRD